MLIPLRTRLLLLLLPQSAETHTRHLDDLETHTRNITLGLALTTETSKQDLVVLVDEVQATVVRHCRMLVSHRDGLLNVMNVRTESGDLLAILDELHTHTLANGRVGLLGLNTDLLEDDTLGVGGALIYCQPPFSLAHPILPFP